MTYSRLLGPRGAVLATASAQTLSLGLGLWLHLVRISRPHFLTRTPMTLWVCGSLLLLSSGSLGTLSEKAGALLDVALRNSKRLALLVDDILDIDKIRSNSMEFSFRPVDVVALARSAVQENATYGVESNVNFRLDDRVGAATVRIDENRMTQVLANLLSNAAKFSPAGSEVVVQVSRVDGKLRCAVIDCGSGIPEDKQPQLFDRFFQVDASDARSKRGTGLGLAIVKAIVEEHGSQIHVESEVGKGSTFYFDLDEVDAISHDGISAGNAQQVSIA